ncbi:hypothetical protein MSG28_012938 [Choristoneura fumiferana]|uniref:Uncharacterized protein n=1 Tax=Choristoneura fumiferana TaxID=7141 RepID=A0ACC0KS01_CHOFU|nr:hypothetical protein MSG28_012938 [Choristoneura fumiferana]
MTCQCDHQERAGNASACYGCPSAAAISFHQRGASSCRKWLARRWINLRTRLSNERLAPARRRKSRIARHAQRCQRAISSKQPSRQARVRKDVSDIFARSAVADINAVGLAHRGFRLNLKIKATVERYVFEVSTVTIFNKFWHWDMVIIIIITVVHLGINKRAASASPLCGLATVLRKRRHCRRRPRGCVQLLARPSADVVGPCARSARIATTILLANPAVKQQCLHCCVSAWRVAGPCARSARIATTILLANPAVKQQCLHLCFSAWRFGSYNQKELRQLSHRQKGNDWLSTIFSLKKRTKDIRSCAITSTYECQKKSTTGSEKPLLRRIRQETQREAISHTRSTERLDRSLRSLNFKPFFTNMRDPPPAADSLQKALAIA